MDWAWLVVAFYGILSYIAGVAVGDLTRKRLDAKQNRPDTTPADDWKRAREEVYAPMMEHLSREAPQSTERPPAPDPTLGAPCRYRRLSGERCPVCEARE